jgi:hypothetical protein
VKWLAAVFAVACALAYVLSPQSAHAQQPRDPLIVPQQGDFGSRFQVVGQSGWTPGETVTIRFGFTAMDPLSFAGPFYHERTVTVLGDGSWSFPINVNDDLFPFALGSNPMFIVVQAQSPTKTATNAFIYAPDGRLPVGAEAIAHLGFGPQHSAPAWAIAAALFLAASGGLIAASGRMRRVGT